MDASYDLKSGDSKMPNDACNTSSFFFLNRIVNIWGLWSLRIKASQTTEDKTGADIDASGPFWGNFGEAHTQMCVWTCAGAFDGQNVLVLNLECQKSWFWLVKAPVNDRKSWLKLLIWQKKKKITTWIHSVRPGQWKEKANWKQSKYFFFSPVNLILYSCCSFSCRWQLRWRGTAEAGAASATPELLWGLAGDGVTAMLHPATCDLLRLSGTSDAAGWGYRGAGGFRSDRWSHWILSVQLWPADRWDGLLSQWRAMMGFSPPLSEVLKPFLMDYLLLHLHMLYSVSLFFPPLSFIL